MPEFARYSHRYKFDVPEKPNESIPHSDAFYTLNILLGFSQFPAPTVAGELPDIKGVYHGCCRELNSPRARIYMFGMALWAGAKLGIEPPGFLTDRVAALVADARRLKRATAQDVGLLASGSVAMALEEGGRWRAAADRLTACLAEHYRDPASHIFYNHGIGYRRRFSSFASQVYSMLALYQFGEAFGADWAIALANEAAARIIELQGPRGEWGWFYYVPRARVVDFYEIYSVHQHGMAPAFLRHAVAHGVAGARAALVKGFSWLFAANEMGVSMLRSDERMFYRSQVRQGELDSPRRRIERSIINAALGRSDTVGNHRRLVLRRECRSYELGWILWSFGAHDDYPELTERAEFAV
jgi:hypothetical protein